MVYAFPSWEAFFIILMGSSEGKQKAQKVIITSGYFNPLHVGHINLLREAKALGDRLVVIVNNDAQVGLKGSVAFMPEQERIEIIKALRYTDEIFLSVDQDRTVAKSLAAVAQQYPGCQLVFAKGGDRNAGNIPESEAQACQQFNVTIANGVGGGKVQSSSWLISESSKTNHGNQ